MPIPLTTYADIKNNYCICYFGQCDEYIVQLRYLRPYIENFMPGLKIHIGYRDNVEYLLEGEERIMSKSSFKKQKKNFAHINQLKCNMTEHPIYKLLKDSNINVSFNNKEEHTIKCVIVAKGTVPTNHLTKEQIARETSKAEAAGYQVSLDGNIEGAGYVVGVESVQLFEAAFKGIKTALIPTGLGTELYKSLFPQGKVIC